jgi:hypothetical protein
MSTTAQMYLLNREQKEVHHHSHHPQPHPIVLALVSQELPTINASKFSLDDVFIEQCFDFSRPAPLPEVSSYVIDMHRIF